MSVVSNAEIFVPEGLPHSESQEQLIDYTQQNNRRTSDASPPPQGRGMSFAVVYFSIFVDMLGFSLIFPSLPKIAVDMGANGFMVGVINASYSTAQMFGSAICGILSDSCGRRPLICFCLLGSAISLTAMGFVTDLKWLVAVRALDGSMSATIGVAQAYIADRTKPRERAKFMGLVGAASGAGVVLGPSIGGFLQNQWSFKITCFVGAGISLCNFIFAVIFLKETKVPSHGRRQSSVFGSSIQSHKKSRNRSIITADNPTGAKRPKYSGIQALLVVYRRNGNIVYVFLSFFLAQFGWTAFNSMFTIFAQQKFGVTAGQIGLIFTEFAVAVILTQIFLTNLATKWVGEKWATIGAALLRAGGLFALTYMPNVPTLIACVTAVAISGALINPCLNALVSYFSDKHTHGGIMGINQLAGAFARGLAPPLCGYLYDYNMDWPFQFFGTIAMGLCAIVMLPLRLPKNYYASRTGTRRTRGTTQRSRTQKSKSSRRARPQRPITDDEAYEGIRDIGADDINVGPEDDEEDSDEEELYRHAISHARRSSDLRQMS